MKSEERVRDRLEFCKGGRIWEWIHRKEIDALEWVLEDDDRSLHTDSDQSAGEIPHYDERTALACAYEGDELLAIAYKRGVVEEWLEGAWFDVVLTPDGLEVFGDD